MAEAVIDLSNYRDRTGSRVPEGDYLVQVEDLEIGQTRKGDPMWTVYLKIIGGDQDGLNLVDRLTLSERAMFRVVGFLTGMGVKTPRKRIKVDTNRLVGRKVKVQVADGEPYNGTIRSEVKAYERYSAPASASADMDALADDVSDEPTDYDEDVEPEKAQEAQKKRQAQQKNPWEDSTPAEDASADTSDDAELDLDSIEID